MENYLQTANVDWYKQRVVVLMLWVLAAFVILFIRLFYLQIIEGREFRRLSENNCIRLQVIDAPRGRIYDRKGEIIVDNRPSFDVSIIAKDAAPLKSTIAELAHYVDMPAEELMQKIIKNKGTRSYMPVLLKKDIGRDSLATIEAHKLDLPGVIVDVRPVRHYIHGQNAAHLVGYLSEINSRELNSGKYSGYRAGDYIGKFGVEKLYEHNLNGTGGCRQVEVNATGRVIRVLNTAEARAGQDIFLTIDQVLQRKAEALLEGKAGAVVAMEPKTGEILVLASAPSFDQNVFVSGMTPDYWKSLVNNPFRPLENKAVQAEYPPGSIYKIVSAIAGLEEGVVKEDTTFECRGYYKYGDWSPRCWKRGGHGKVNIVRALAESCDVFFYNVGQQLGVDKLAYYASGCGLGSPTGIKLGYEARGLIPNAAWKKKQIGVEWQGGETLSVVIGQSYNLVTPIQAAVMISAIANGGILKEPVIVKSIGGAEADGRIIKKKMGTDVGRIPASKETLEIIKKGLWEVVNTKKGTAWNVHINGLDICGKTGTAQVVGSAAQEDSSEEEQPDIFKPHAWFIAYAPLSEPEIAIAVMVEHGEHGSTGAGPIARELIKIYLKEEKGVKEEPVTASATDKSVQDLNWQANVE